MYGSISASGTSKARVPSSAGFGMSRVLQSEVARRARAVASGRSLRCALRASNSARARCCFSATSARKAGFCSGDRSALTTFTTREASSTCTAPCAYCGAIFTAVCGALVVAPPMSSGTCSPSRVISRATCTISSSEGVIRPESPMTSTCCSCAAAEDLARRTPSRPGRRPRSCCRPAPRPRCSCRCRARRPSRWRAAPCPGRASPPPRSAVCLFSSSMKGVSQATARFITRADFTTWGRNILPAPNRSPTTRMPSMSGPSMMSQRARILLPRLLGVGLDEGVDALHQRVREALRDRRARARPGPPSAPSSRRRPAAPSAPRRRRPAARSRRGAG